MKNKTQLIHHTDKFSQNNPVILPDWLRSWMFVYKLRGCGFESCCSHLFPPFKCLYLFRYGYSVGSGERNLFKKINKIPAKIFMYKSASYVTFFDK